MINKSSQLQWHTLLRYVWLKEVEGNRDCIFLIWKAIGEERNGGKELDLGLEGKHTNISSILPPFLSENGMTNGASETKKWIR